LSWLFKQGAFQIVATDFRSVGTPTEAGEWENPLNWSCGAMPDSNTNVVITKGNIFINASTTIRSLTLSPGANLTIATGAKLTIFKWRKLQDFSGW